MTPSDDSVDDPRLLESAHIIPWEADPVSWCLTYFGPQAEDILGYPPQAWYP